MTPDSLASTWRERAEYLREFGLPEGNGARIWERAAAELEQALNAAALEPLSIKQAAAESGMHPGSIGRMLRRDLNLNAGRPGSPAILRRNLPTKTKKPLPNPVSKVSMRSLVDMAVTSRR